MHNKIHQLGVAAALVMLSANASAGPTAFETFTPMVGNVAAGSLPETAPFQLASPNFTQTVLANRLNQNNLVPGSNSGN
jgi:uncharacterized protein